MMQRQGLKIVAFFALLLLIDSFLYFRHAGHFFQGDTIFLLNHRATSLSGYLTEFIELNPSGWFRPLTNELIESILFPIVGLSPVPYRIPVYATFIAVTVAVYALTLALTGRRLAAGLAAFFFSVHTANAYTTYDVGFMPELLYSFFYLAAVLAFLRYLNTESKVAYRLSLAFFAGSLLSKEAAVTLPATLFLMAVCMSAGPRAAGKRLMRAARLTMPHVLVMLLYLSYAFAHLHVMDFSIAKLFDSSQTPNPGDYVAVLNGGVLKNADLAFSWSFNIPRPWWGQAQNDRIEPSMMAYLKFFRVLALALSLLLLFGPKRKILLLGFGWFWITLIPALPLVAHFIPYYVFLPVAGLSVVIGAGFTQFYDLLARRQAAVASAAIALLFGGVLYVNSITIHGDILNNNLLGASARAAWTSLNDLKTLHPTLRAGTTLFFADANESLAWHHDLGGLIKMAYGTDLISTLYESQGDALFPEVTDVIVLGVVKGRLDDRTAAYRADPGTVIKFQDSPLRLELSKSEVTLDQDTYAVSIKHAEGAPVRIAYTIDDGPLETFRATLDAMGQATFNVSRTTKPGVYKFWGFKLLSGESPWIRADRTLTVHASRQQQSRALPGARKTTDP
jgi:hypothetical protein